MVYDSKEYAYFRFSAKIIIVDHELITLIITSILVIQTVVLMGLLFRDRKTNLPRKQLVLVMFFYLLSLLNVIVFYGLYFSNRVELSRFFQLELVYGFGPSLYLYTKSLTDKEYRFTKSQWIHFLPVLLEFLFYRSPLFYEGAIPLTAAPKTFANFLYVLSQWGGMLSVLIYLTVSLLLLRSYRDWVKRHYSNLERKTLGWYETPIITYAVFWSIWIGVRIVDYVVFEEAFRPYYFNLGFIIVAFITLWIGFKGYVTAEVTVAGFLKKPKGTGDRKTDLDHLKKVSDHLKGLMEEQRFYLDSDLSLAKFAKLTDISEKDISKAINFCQHRNFHEFVNGYRVEAFKKNLERQDLAHLNLLGVAFESGFGSKSTFNLVFKKSTGMTPKQYVADILKKKS